MERKRRVVESNALRKRKVNKRNIKLPLLIVFDLDETLWDGNRLFDNIGYMLRKLNENNHYVCLATFNKNPIPILNKFNIYNYFRVIVYNNKKSKLSMIQHCKKMLKLSPNYKTLFFDDNPVNIFETDGMYNCKSFYVPDGIRNVKTVLNLV